MYGTAACSIEPPLRRLDADEPDRDADDAGGPPVASLDQAERLVERRRRVADGHDGAIADPSGARAGSRPPIASGRPIAASAIVSGLVQAAEGLDAERLGQIAADPGAEHLDVGRRPVRAGPECRAERRVDRPAAEPERSPRNRNRPRRGSSGATIGAFGRVERLRPELAVDDRERFGHDRVAGGADEGAIAGPLGRSGRRLSPHRSGA